MSFRAWDSWNRGGQCKSYIFFPLPIMNTNFMAFTKRTYTAEHVKTALRVYHSVRSFRMASTRTGIPKSTIHRWTCRLGRVIERNRTRKTWKSTKRRNARFESCCKLLDDLLRDGPFKTLKDMQWALQVTAVFKTRTGQRIWCMTDQFSLVVVWSFGRLVVLSFFLLQT